MMKTTSQPKREDHKVTTSINVTERSRGHGFVIARGGKHQDQRGRKPRTAKGREW